MSTRLRFAGVALAAALAGCGHDGYERVPVGVPVVGLELLLTRVGPTAVQVEWSTDARASVYRVSRDGFPLADVQGNVLIDAALALGGRYCYSVLGLAATGQVLSQSSVGCLTVI